MSKIYTKTGDAGTTGLFGGQRVAKTDPRILAYGTIDELNAWIGLVAAQHKADATRISAPELQTLLEQIQRQLFDIGAHLATPYRPGESVPTSLPKLQPQAIQALELSIDTMTAALPALRQFILPGGSILSSQVHIARTICRRAERYIVALNAAEALDPIILQYCNRLSDWLFTLARYYNIKLNEPEITWK